jgi:predicted ATPase
MTGVVAGRGGSVLIEGEPGIGKSTLVRAALAEATETETACQVFWSAGDELGQALPLLPLLEALRSGRAQQMAPPSNSLVVPLEKSVVPLEKTEQTENPEPEPGRRRAMPAKPTPSPKPQFA